MLRAIILLIALKLSAMTLSRQELLIKLGAARERTRLRGLDTSVTCRT